MFRLPNTNLELKKLNEIPIKIQKKLRCSTWINIEKVPFISELDRFYRF